MFKNRPVDDYFDIIKKNHKHYLETTMVTHLTLSQAEHKKPVIDRYLACIHNYCALERRDLDDAIQGDSLAKKAGRGAFAALIGAGIGGLIFAGEQHAPSADVFGAKALVQGGFAGMLGVSCSAVIYKVWSKSGEKPAHADLMACAEEMSKAGFNNEKYAALSANIVKLFYFRECLLLGLLDKNNNNMRESFVNRYYSKKQAQTFNDDDFNMAIEIYFINQLNEVFFKAFQTIYQAHDQEIKEEEALPVFIRWFKRHFESEENQQRFTQQMQVEFLHHCMNFFEKQMDEPTFIGKYPFLIDSLAGLIAGSIAMGIVAVSIPFIPLLGLIGIGIMAGSFAAVGLHVAITKTDALKFKRDPDNRHAIANVIKLIGTEQNRLTTLIQKVVKTTRHDLETLKQHNQRYQANFLTILHIQSAHRIAIGSVGAWIRDFINHFNESKVVEIDLSSRIKAITHDAHEQTEHLQKEWAQFMYASSEKHELTQLTQVIQDTTHYLKNPENMDFIIAFELVQKIKEQILEIIGFVPSGGQLSRFRSKPLPAILVNFYTSPISEGGLNGLISDLNEITQIAPIAACHKLSNDFHPYHPLLQTAFSIQLKLNTAVNADFILPGDCKYRSILGLPNDHCIRLESKITVANIQDFLTHSFDFLCSLNQYDTMTGWDTPFQNHEAFILYRTLFVKQLANLADPNNLRVDNLIKEDILRFVREKLNCNPSIAFDDILNQALLIAPNPIDGILLDPLGNRRSINELSYIADAIRVNVAYVSSPFTPQQLIQHEAIDFLKNNTDQVIIGYQSMGQLIPYLSSRFYDKVQDALMATTQFMKQIETRALLLQTGTIRIYTQVVFMEIEHIKEQIRQFILLSTNQIDAFHTENLSLIMTALDDFQQRLSVDKSQLVQAVDLAPQRSAEVTIEIVPPSPVAVPVQQDLQPQDEEKDDTPIHHTLPLGGELMHVLTAAETGLSNAAHVVIEIIQNEFAPPKPLDTRPSPRPSIDMEPVAQDYIDELQQFMKEEEEAIERESKIGFFYTKPIPPSEIGWGHHHSRNDKIKAARTLIEALEQLKLGETIDAHNWSDEIYTTNKHLKRIIQKYCPRGSDPLQIESRMTHS